MSDLLQLLLLAVAAAFYPTLLAIVVLVLSRPNPARVLAWFLAGAAFVSVTIGLAAVLLLDTANFVAAVDGVRRHLSSGHVVMEWLSGHSSIAVYQSMRDIVHIHGHGGKTTIEWQDT